MSKAIPVILFWKFEQYPL